MMSDGVHCRLGMGVFSVDVWVNVMLIFLTFKNESELLISVFMVNTILG